MERTPDIDFVVTYVNPDDDEWFKLFNRTSMRHHRIANRQSERYRDYETLRYQLRGVDKYMPWIRKVHLIVQMESQIPKWINRDEVNVVLHKDIIPSKHRPTYNSTVIELFMYKIKGLSERFIYGNDDMIPVGDLTPEDFFDGELPRFKITEKPYGLKSGLYSRHLHNGESLAREVLGMPEQSKHVYRLGHNLSPMLVSTWQMLWEKAEKNLHASASPFRSIVNINQDVAAIYHILSGNYTESERRTGYYEMDALVKLRETLRNDNPQLICVNDAHGRRFESDRELLHKILNRKLSNKSKYEL